MYNVIEVIINKNNFLSYGNECDRNLSIVQLFLTVNAKSIKSRYFLYHDRYALRLLYVHLCPSFNLIACIMYNTKRITSDYTNYFIIRIGQIRILNVDRLKLAPNLI